jgi:hypothetical protein
MMHEPNYRLLAKAVAATMIEEEITKNNGFPIDRHDYKLDLSMVSDMVHVSENVKEWIMDNSEKFEGMVNNALSNHINYIQLEGFGYAKNGLIKLYTNKQITNQIQKILD